MPLSSTVNRRRARSTELSANVSEIRNIAERRSKNVRLFEDRIRDNSITIDPYFRWNSHVIATAHNSTFVDYEIISEYDYDDLLYYVNNLRFELESLLTDAFISSPYGGVAFSIDVVVKYYALDDPKVTSERTLTSDYYPIYTFDDIIKSCTAASEDIMIQNEYYQHGRSNWVIEDIIRVILKYQFVKPSRLVVGGGRFSKMITKKGGRSYIPSPKWLENKKCLVNIQNKDDMCFKYAMECAFYHKMIGKLPTHPNRVTNYSSNNNFVYDGIEEPVFPIHLLDLEKFESLNKHIHNVALHVYTASSEPNDIGVLYSSKNDSDTAWHVELLIIVDEQKKEQVNAHWIYITNYTRFFASPSVNKRFDRFICRRCTLDFPSEQRLTEHKPSCGKQTQGRPVLPYDYEKWKYFKDFNKKLIREFVIYADFEAFNDPLTHSTDSSKSEQNRLTEHIGASFCFHTVCRSRPEFNKTVIYTYDKDDLDDKTRVGRRFIGDIEMERERINGLIQQYFSYPLHIGDSIIEPDDCCKICKLHLNHGFMPHWKYKNCRLKDSFKDDKEYFTRLRAMKKKPYDDDFQEILLAENREIIDIWDASKQFNNFIGKAHHACGYWRPGVPSYWGRIPVVFHNLSGYDAHFILKALDPSAKGQNMKFGGIPQSGDKFMSFSFRGLQFIDSLKFMNSSLDSLSQNLLKSGKNNFTNFLTHFKDKTEDVQTLLLQKGEFPYEYFNHPRVFKETSLPPIECFHSQLYDKDISHEDYQKALKVWNHTNCKSFKDYHDLYLVVDVLLLADIFENFRTLCLQQDGLDPVNYVSLPGYCMDSAFIFCGSRWDGNVGQSDNFPFCVDLFTRKQEDMYTFVEESIRGGVSMTPGRYSKANHKYLQDFDSNLISKYILYLDANNLYGFAMNQLLPFCDYTWVKPELVDLMSIPRDSPVGFIFEVDGYFPDSTHDYLSDFPPNPVNQIVTEDMLSPLSISMNERYNNKHDDKTEKLLCTLEPRKFYKCYYATLQLYCTLGFVITKVHRVLRFHQSDWLSKYINFNTTQRAKSKNAFEKDFYKLKNNSVYGKFIQNNRKFREVRPIDRNKDKIKWSPHLVGRGKIINENFVLGYFYPGKIDLNSPVIVGSVILDHSKYLMYHFYYIVMKQQYRDSLRLLFTDTDSLCMEITHDDPMNDLHQTGVLKEWFDLDEYPKDDSYYGFNYQDSTNKKVIGKFKDEFVKDGKGVYITEVVALRSKMYSCLQSDGVNKQTAKGVTAAAKRKLQHEKYVACVMQTEKFEIEKVPMISLRSDGFNVMNTISITKATISPCDSKLYLIDQLHTKPYGHYSLPVRS